MTGRHRYHLGFSVLTEFLADVFLLYPVPSSALYGLS
jgi:hypothetical protein